MMDIRGLLSRKKDWVSNWVSNKRNKFFGWIEKKGIWIFFIDFIRIYMKTWDFLARLLMVSLIFLLPMYFFLNIGVGTNIIYYVYFVLGVGALVLILFLTDILVILIARDDIQTTESWFYQSNLIYVTSYLREANRKIRKINDGLEQKQKKKLIKKSIGLIKNSMEFLTTEFHVFGIPKGFRIYRVLATENEYVNAKIRKRIWGLINQLNELSFKLIICSQKDLNAVSDELEGIIKDLKNIDIRNFNVGIEPDSKLKKYKGLVEGSDIFQIISMIIVAVAYLLKSLGLV